MTLKTTVLRSVQTIRKALADLIFKAQLIQRTKKGYVPGEAVKYIEVVYDVDVVISSFDQNELDSDRVNVLDVKLIVFPLIVNGVSVIPQSNDVMVIKGENYRIVKNDPTYAGFDIALNTIQARPSGQS